MRWMNLQPIKQSQVSPKEKTNTVYYHIYMESRRMVLMNLFAGQQWRCMKCSLGISDFLEEISSLSHSVVFLNFFALIAEEGFLI